MRSLWLSLFLASGVGCAGDDDLTEGRGFEDTGPALTAEADPPDTSVAPDTTPVDSSMPDTTIVDSAVVDTSMPETPFFCTSPTECPGVDTDCAKRGCVDGKCRVDNIAPDTPTASQVKGDCKKTECDGVGGIRILEDLSDVPADPSECATNTCTTTGPKEVFRGAGTPCTKGGSFCDGAGKCVECVAATTCPGTDSECRKRACVMNACTMANTPDGTPAEMQTAADCKIRVCDGAGGVRVAPADTDVPASDGNPCTREGCSSGTPVTLAPAPSTPCGAGKTCDVARPGICGQCNVVGDCTTPPACKTPSACTSNSCIYTNVMDTTPCPLPGGVTGWCSGGVCFAPIG
jgi:hypothetical protein